MVEQSAKKKPQPHPRESRDFESTLAQNGPHPRLLRVNPPPEPSIVRETKEQRQRRRRTARSALFGCRGQYGDRRKVSQVVITKIRGESGRFWQALTAFGSSVARGCEIGEYVAWLRLLRRAPYF